MKNLYARLVMFLIHPVLLEVESRRHEAERLRDEAISRGSGKDLIDETVRSVREKLLESARRGELGARFEKASSPTIHIDSAEARAGVLRRGDTLFIALKDVIPKRERDELLDRYRALADEHGIDIVVFAGTSSMLVADTKFPAREEPAGDEITAADLCSGRKA